MQRVLFAPCLRRTRAHLVSVALAPSRCEQAGFNIHTQTALVVGSQPDSDRTAIVDRAISPVYMKAIEGGCLLQTSLDLMDALFLCHFVLTLLQRPIGSWIPLRPSGRDASQVFPRPRRLQLTFLDDFLFARTHKLHRARDWPDEWITLFGAPDIR